MAFIPDRIRGNRRDVTNIGTNRKSRGNPDTSVRTNTGSDRILDYGGFFLLCWGLTTRQPLWVILCRLPEKGRKEIEEIVEEMKETIREEIGTGMKVKKQKK